MVNVHLTKVPCAKTVPAAIKNFDEIKQIKMDLSKNVCMHATVHGTAVTERLLSISYM